MNAAEVMAKASCKRVQALFAWAMEADLVRCNPTLGVRKIKYPTVGHHRWTPDGDLAIQGQSPDRQPSPHALHHRAPGGRNPTPSPARQGRSHPISRITGLTVHLDETAIPVHPPVRAVCNMLGYDPLYLACEGRIVAVLSAEDAPQARSARHAGGFYPVCSSDTTLPREFSLKKRVARVAQEKAIDFIAVK